MNNPLNLPGFEPKEQERYHTETIYDENDDVIGWKYILDDNNHKIPLGICICAARSYSECGCSCNSWEPNSFYDDEEDGWYDEQLKWDECRDMSFSRHLENF